MEVQHDDHIWLTVGGKAWAIAGIDWPMFELWRGYWPDLEFLVIDMSGFTPETYTRRALAMLREEYGYVQPGYDYGGEGRG